MVTVFSVNPPPALADIVFGTVAVLVIIGIVVALLSFRVAKEKRAKLLVVGTVLLVAGGGVFFFGHPTSNDSIAVGQGSVQVSASYFNINVTAAQISHAYVVNLSDWNVSITTRNDGSALGSFHSGLFTLSNGARADVLSTGDANLVLVLDSGKYVILGPSDFQAFLSSFNQSVMQLSNG